MRVHQLTQHRGGSWREAGGSTAGHDAGGAARSQRGPGRGPSLLLMQSEPLLSLHSKKRPLKALGKRSWSQQVLGSQIRAVKRAGGTVRAGTSVAGMQGLFFSDSKFPSRMCLLQRLSSSTLSPLCSPHLHTAGESQSWSSLVGAVQGLLRAPCWSFRPGTSPEPKLHAQ